MEEGQAAAELACLSGLLGLLLGEAQVPEVQLAGLLAEPNLEPLAVTMSKPTLHLPYQGSHRSGFVPR